MALQNIRGIDQWLIVRRAWVTHLRAFAPLTALVSSASIYGEEPTVAEPSWPFIRIGLPTTTPYFATGQSGSGHTVITHAFAKGKFTDSISRIATQVAEAIDAFSIPTLDLVDRQWTGTKFLPDPAEVSAYHAVIAMNVIAVQSA